ncbi:G-protein beta WD-40 repeats containing protein, partial [Reticulomyxa filosa]
TFSFDLFCSSSKLLKTFSGHTSYVNSIDYSIFNDCQYICSGSRDNTVRVWDVKTAKQIKEFNGHSHFVYCAKFSPYHYYYCGLNHLRPTVCSSSQDKTIRFWDFETSKEFQVLNGHTGWVSGITFSPFNNGRYLCSTSSDKTVRLWDVETYKALHIFNGHKGAVWCVDFSPLLNYNSNKSNSTGVIGGNGYTFCSGSYDNTICLWDIETAKECSVFKGHEHVVGSVKYSPYETNILCSGSGDRSIRLWDLRSKKEIQIFRGHTNEIWAVEYAPFVLTKDSSCGKILCSGARDNTIRFWDIRINKQMHAIKGIEGDNGILAIQFLSLEKKDKSVDGNDYCVNLYYEYKTLNSFVQNTTKIVGVNVSSPLIIEKVTKMYWKKCKTPSFIEINEIIETFNEIILAIHEGRKKKKFLRINEITVEHVNGDSDL